MKCFCQFRGEGNVHSQRNRGGSGKKRGNLQSEAKNSEIVVNDYKKAVEKGKIRK